ncbi:MAG: cell wall hydrolase, partial [Pseudomonadota bacterium]
VDARIDVDAAPAARFVRAERDCLADAIYHEARSESVAGQLAVADVILNRRDARRYPDTICGVVYQGSERITGCQFSFTCDGSLDRRINARKRREAEGLADVVLAGLRPGVSRDATHYHAYYVDPPWAKRLTPTAEIGAHKFYRAPGEIVLAAAPLQF